uniref:Endo/exonuclease/phosphatase domain-containing protein n=1 Tax=Rodentolepis nana TaxID=102285 RepID=A0A0R3TCU1_RODNA
LHYNGTRTTPDLLLASSDISKLTRRKIIDDPGSAHKPIIASITIGGKSMTMKVCDELKARTKEKQWTVALSNIADWAGIEAVAEFGRRTGHDCLEKHLHRLEEEMEKTHLIRCLAEEMVMTHLIRCPALKTTQTHLIRCPALKTRTWSLIVKPTGGNGEDPSDSLQEKMEKTHLIRCSKEEMEKTHLIRCLAINPHALYVTYRRKSGEAPSQIRRGNGEDLPDSVSSP